MFYCNAPNRTVPRFQTGKISNTQCIGGVLCEAQLNLISSQSTPFKEYSECSFKIACSCKNAEFNMTLWEMNGEYSIIVI
uniref:Uncharacterized protein n=1 Tax=Anguilla anguilla TaxID=7936 RepID=A0A0E9WSR6_ANGAN